MRWPLLLPALLAATLATGLAGCASDGHPVGDGVEVVAAFYPLHWATEQVGGPHVTVTNLTPASAEPHDLELTPTDVVRLADADLVVHLSGFQPAVDDALANAGGAVVDAADHVALLPLPGSDAPDPHLWLDPLRLADVGDAVAEALADLDPDHAAAYRANAAGLRDRLVALDEELTATLATCEDRHLVTSHAAFGYLAERYGFEQVGITGLSPEGEPSPAELAAVVAFVEDHDVSTLYVETLASPAVAETVAAETGATVATLDPLEGLDDRSAGEDYLAVMRANLAQLVAGQSCR